MQASTCCALRVVGVLLFAPLPSFAQEPAQLDAGGLVREAPLTPNENTILGNALVFDPAALATPPKKPLRLLGSSRTDYDVSRKENLDGSSSIVVNQPLQTEWRNSVGANLGPSSPRSAFDHPQPMTRDSTPSGSAWASLGVPNVGGVDALVDPSVEKGKVGTTFKQSIPFGGQLAVTLQSSYSVTATFAQPSGGPGDIPLMSFASGPAGATPQVFGNERSVKFNILPTGTTLGAGMTTASNDPVTHNTFSAEQKFYGPLQVTTAVSDFGQASSSKSITAGFKLHW